MVSMVGLRGSSAGRLARDCRSSRACLRREGFCAADRGAVARAKEGSQPPARALVWQLRGGSRPAHGSLTGYGISHTNGAHKHSGG